MLKVIEVTADVPGDADAVVLLVLDTQVEGSEKTGAARDTRTHEAELPKALLPLLGANARLASEVVEDGLKAFFAMGRQLQSLPHCVNDPAQNDLPDRP